MSKSRGNVVGIDETVETYGVDAMRLFLLKAAPPEDALEWTDEGIVGRVRFIQRVWRACEPLATWRRRRAARPATGLRGEAQRELVRALHLAAEVRPSTKPRRGASTTTSRPRGSTSWSTCSPPPCAIRRSTRSGGALRACTRCRSRSRRSRPHIADELWSRMGHRTSVHIERCARSPIRRPRGRRDHDRRPGQRQGARPRASRTRRRRGGRLSRSR